MAEMNPSASLPAGVPLLLGTGAPSAPITRYFSQRSVQGLPPPQRKALRPRKERLPVASTVDDVQVRNPQPQITPSLPPAGQPAAPGQIPYSSFPGGRHNNTTIPPDTAGAVGPTHVFHPLNNDVFFLDRQGSHIQNMSLDSFWSALLNQQLDTFDPRTVYDHDRGRFIFVTMAEATKPTSSLLIATSTSSDPTQTWVGHIISVDDAAQGPVWLDYPSVGFSGDKVTVQVNLFRRDNNMFAGSTIYAFDKNSLYAGTPALQRFDLINQGGTQVPVVTHDPGVLDQLLIGRWSGNAGGSGILAAYRIAGNVAVGQANLTRIGFITSGNLTWDSFAPSMNFGFAPQVGIPQNVSVGDDRILAACLRNNTLYCSHTVMLPAGGPSRSAVQWWEIDSTSWQINHLGRMDDPEGNMFYAFPTIAANANDDVALGFSQFSASMHPSASFAYRPQGGTMSGAVIFGAGRATYFITFGGQSNRWGDYSATMVDPVDDTTFWTVQELAETPTDTWATMWATFPTPTLPTQPAQPQPPPPSV